MDISILITNYNKGALLERAVRSALSQVLIRKTVEVIIVDDASTDGSLEFIADVFDQCKIIKHPKNLGVATASNTALSASEGKYWLRLDADDYLSQFALQYMSAVLDSNPDIGFVTADHLLINKFGESPEVVSLADEHILLEHGAGVLFRRDLIEKHGGYNSNLRNCEDFDLIARYFSLGIKRFHLPIPLYRYFKQIDGLTKNDDRKKVLKELRAKYAI